MFHDKQKQFEEFSNCADQSVKETIEMFFKYPSGFHGDTGLQHYLYHRILTNSGPELYWRATKNSEIGTLLFQSEVYTQMTYLKTGKTAKSGRFDMAFVSPPTNTNLIIPEKLEALIAFEVGRNKSIKIMGDINAPEEAEAPKPGDAAKIIRDLRFGKLQAGYILEFFDRRTSTDIHNARKIAKELGSFLKKIENIKCHIAICLFQTNNKPMIWLYPDSWADNLDLDYDRLNFKQQIPNSHKYKNRVNYEEFFELCGDCGRSLQEAIHKNFSKKLRLLYGGKTMTVNDSKTKSRLLRISNKYDNHNEEVRNISDQMKTIFLRNKIPVINDVVSIPEKIQDDFIQLILESISAYLDQRKFK